MDVYGKTDDRLNNLHTVNQDSFQEEVNSQFESAVEPASISSPRHTEKRQLRKSFQTYPIKNGEV